MWADYDFARTESRKLAETAGWLFLDGRTVRPFCPDHGAAASSRHNAILAAQADYVAQMAGTR
jgi:hypothetical protein